MKKENVKNFADASLVVSFLGTLAVYPFQQSFIGGLFFSGLSAATIGGIADTFAVSALFRHPLRIPWPRFMGTRIIPRNRERLVNEIVSMVQHELLSIPNIQRKLGNYHVASLLMTYLKERGGEQDMERLVQRFASDVLHTVDVRELADSVQNFLLDQAGELQISDLLADIGEWTIRNGYDDKLIEFFVHELIRLVKTEEFRELAERIINSAIETYENGRTNRKFVNSVAGISGDNLSKMVQEKLSLLLLELLSPEHPNHQKLKEQAASFVQRLRDDEALRARVEEGKLTLLALLREQLDLGAYLEDWIQAYRQRAAEQPDGSALFPWLQQSIHSMIGKLDSNEAAIDRLDALIKKNVLVWIERQHSSIGKLVRDGLNAFSEEQLVQFVHDKAGHDLQFIRLNGTFVGGLIGIVLYLATFWIGR
ncbi:DUF445 domain-containing protein [Paenibacillus mendelii]|uniref:DUF445 domain-containing protein n=1 Tax=Paenibacillus mendelii TaxID=206163 RepID=A0ABV6JKC6_9BACL|nr:DUF445 domain-containing protein [Paenibacillus mendelii]MCQ6559197.1 DUF445 domain-containing protein [Paenibacillus mendelii]